MATPADRMKAMRARRRAGGQREVRLVLPDGRTRAVRTRVARAVAKLDSKAEADALAWIESISEFDAPDNPASR